LVIARVNPLTHWLSSPAFRVVTLGLHAVLLLSLSLHHGILADKEALKYIGCAEQVLHGDFHDLFGNYVKYASYVVFLLPFLAIGAPELAIVAQIILGIAAAFALSRLAERTTKDPRTGRRPRSRSTSTADRDVPGSRGPRQDFASRSHLGDRCRVW